MNPSSLYLKYLQWRLQSKTRALISHEEKYFEHGAAMRDIFALHFANQVEEELRREVAEIERKISRLMG